MSSPPIGRSVLTDLARLSKVLPRSAEMSRQVAAQSQMEALLYAVRRAIAAGNLDDLPKLAAEANRVARDFTVACEKSATCEDQTITALGSAIRGLCNRALGV